jgi:hypothetical protein
MPQQGGGSTRQGRETGRLKQAGPEEGIRSGSDRSNALSDQEINDNTFAHTSSSRLQDAGWQDDWRG